MPFTDRLREQHDVATLATRQLRRLVSRHRPGGDAISIATQLARLHGLLRIHLAEEDQTLYPAMIVAHDRIAAALAERYKEEMGALAWDLEDFMQHWSSSVVIALDFTAFETALDMLLGVLAARIMRENTTLYPVADALFPQLQGKAA